MALLLLASEPALPTRGWRVRARPARGPWRLSCRCVTDGYHQRRRRQRERAQRFTFERGAGDLYEVLGVDSDCDVAEIKRSWHSKMKHIHPDVAGTRALCSPPARAGRGGVVF
eukprot:scaffold924_cov188-Prasinococcus_capsulatus_cf.AAC.1